VCALVFQALKCTSLSIVGLQAAVGALALVDALHVAGVPVGSGVQRDAVPPVRLQWL